MKKYRVNVNGTNYEIAVEALGEGEVSAAPKTAVPVAQTAAPSGEGEKVNAPMPGNILDVKVNVGDTVKEGQVLMVLEAMKMENEIMAGVSGTITSVAVAKGATVETGTLLCTIK